MSELITWFLSLKGGNQALLIFWVGLVIGSVRLVEIKKETK